MRARRDPQSGYALLVVAGAVLFLALASTVIVRAAVTSGAAAVYEADQAQASLTAQTGIEWIIGVSKTNWSGTLSRTFPSDGGSWKVEKTGAGNRAVTSTGKRGAATRVCISEFAFFYVPKSRHVDTDGSVVFELYNMTGVSIGWSGLSFASSQPGFFEEVRVLIFSNAAGGAAPNSIDYGTVWSYASQGGGSRAGAGSTITFGTTATIGNNRQALVELRGWKAASGGGATVDMDGAELLVTPRQGATVMPGIPIPTVAP